METSAVGGKVLSSARRPAASCHTGPRTPSTARTRVTAAFGTHTHTQFRQYYSKGARRRVILQQNLWPTHLAAKKVISSTKNSICVPGAMFLAAKFQGQPMDLAAK